MNPTVINGYQVAGSDLLALTVDGHDVMHLRYVAPDTEAAPLTPEQIDAINSTVINAMGFATISPAKPATDWSGDPARMLALLARAESFISGFEDDEEQEGVPALLADLRAAQAGQVADAPAEPREIGLWAVLYEDDNGPYAALYPTKREADGYLAEIGGDGEVKELFVTLAGVPEEGPAVRMIRDALAYEADEFDGDGDLDVSPSDLVDWFTGWREEAREAIEVPPAPPARLLVVCDIGGITGIISDSPALIGHPYTTLEYDVEGIEAERCIKVRQPDGTDREAYARDHVISAAKIPVMPAASYPAADLDEEEA